MNGIEIKEIRDYFEKLASEHRQIRHSSNKKGFFCYDVDEFTGVPHKSKMSEFPLILSEIKPRFRKNSGHLKSRMRVSFMIMKQPGDNIRDFEKQYKAFDEAYNVGIEVVARIIEDSRNSDCPRIMAAITGNEFEANMVGPYPDHHVGWKFTFEFDSIKTIQYKAESWQ